MFSGQKYTKYDFIFLKYWILLPTLESIYLENHLVTKTGPKNSLHQNPKPLDFLIFL